MSRIASDSKTPKDGKIAERRVSADWGSMMQQLGLVPPPLPAK